MSVYTDNLEKIRHLITRNEANIITIDIPSFWISDVKQGDGTNLIQVEFNSVRNWLKFKQQQGGICTLLPIDGHHGVFLKEGLPVNDKNKFVYKWETEKEIKLLPAGDCDCLILHSEWHFFEFKTEAISNNPLQLNNNRNKGEMQLAKSLTSFREQFVDFNIQGICILVVPNFSSFPKFKSNFIRKIRFEKLFKSYFEEVPIDGNFIYSVE